MLYLSVRSRSSTLGCVASIHGRITPGDILVCVQQRHMKKVMGIIIVTTVMSHACSQYKNVLWESTEWYSDDAIPTCK